MRKKIIYYAVFFFAVVGLAAGIVLFFERAGNIKAATFGWLQTDWSGGASTTAFANHANDQSGWNKFYSKSANVDTSGGEVKLSVVAATTTYTTDTDFNAFTLDQAYVSGGAVYAKKPDGGSCSSNGQCINNWCNANVCTNPWLIGPCSGIGVYYQDSGTAQWKTSDTACDTPQCGQNGGQDGDTLVADNTVDFSTYPARNTCKTLGGRLPTTAELQCVHTNKTIYDDFGVFQSGAYYWSNKENSITYAYDPYFSTIFNAGTMTYKTSSNYIRCVKTQ